MPADVPAGGSSNTGSPLPYSSKSNRAFPAEMTGTCAHPSTERDGPAD